MRVLSFLESVDFEKETGVFFTRKENDKEWLRVNVIMSKLLLYRIKHFDKERRLPITKHYVDTLFVSTVDSKLYVENPFHLVRFVPDKGVKAPEFFKLEAVDEMKFKTIDIMTDKLSGYQYGYKQAKYYVRESLIKLTNDFDTSRPFPVAHDKTFVPVIE